MWMNKKVWTAGGPAAPDPRGQNARENPAGNISLNPLFIHFQSVCQVAAEYKCVHWPPHSPPHMLDDTDFDQPAVVCSLVLLGALRCSVSRSTHRADPQPVNCDP